MSAKILAVDDSKSIREMVSFVLEGAGYEVVEAENGQLGLDQAKAEKYDLVISDQNMPVMDGLTMIKELRSLPEYQSIPILMLTTESDDDMKMKGREAGATGWIVKPFNPEKLLTVISKVLG